MSAVDGSSEGKRAQLAMRDGSGDDVRARLATLLGKPRNSIGPVWKTGETPPRISVIDVAALITGKDANNAARDVAFVKDRHPEISKTE